VKLKATSILFAIFIFGCAAPSVMNKLSVGMTKAEVIQTLGKPYGVSAVDQTENLEYHFNAYKVFPEVYWVRLERGKVISFGQPGDWGTADTEEKYRVNLDIE
jgi:hypothetical protein